MSFTLRPRDPAGSTIPASVDTDLAQLAEIALAPVFIGPQGAPGAPYVPTEVNVVAMSDGGQTITLPVAARAGGTLFINGVAQRNDTYAVAATLLSIPPTLDVLTGDLLTFVYPT
jgi:hypothetical protein